jgi:hypothetical protein
MENTISEIADFIKRYKCVANINFTLGKYTDEFNFEKNLFHEENYNLILNLLNSNDNWEGKKENTLNVNNKTTFKIIDTLIYKIQNSPYDMIVTAESKKSQTIYISEEYIKKETFYTRKCHTFHISHENSIQYGNVYNFNIIFTKNESTDTYNSHSSLLKILDVIKTVDTCGKNNYAFEKL